MQMYVSKKDEYIQRYAFQECKQKKKEAITEFVLALRTIAKECRFVKTEVNNQIKSQLSTFRDLIQYESVVTSLDELKRLAKTVEMANT